MADENHPSSGPQVAAGRFLLVILLATLLGAYLRLYLIGDQILGEDEWNGFRRAIHSSYNEILTTYHMADNCIPLTLYYKLLLGTTGLDENGLRSLQLLAGIVSLILLPWIIRPLLGERAALLFALFLSLSPFLVFYSRFSRPYIIVVLLCFPAFFSLHRWIRTGTRRYAAGYWFLAVLAPYFNLFALVFVAAPLLYFMIFSAPGKRGPCEGASPSRPGRMHLLVLGVLLLVGWGAWFLPAADSFKAVIQKAGADTIDLSTLGGFVTICTGSGSYPFLLALPFLFLFGIKILFKRDQGLCGAILFTLILQLASIIAVRPTSVHFPMVFTRYFISCLPLWFLPISLALETLSRQLGLALKRGGPLLSDMLLAAFFIALYLTGPLPGIYKAPNNFTNHPEYQYSYHMKPFEFGDEQIRRFPAFYSELSESGEGGPIIETPLLSRWSLTNFHLYQRLHGRKVLIGHTGKSYIAQKGPLMHENVRFKNFISLENTAALRKSKAAYVVVHKDLLREHLHVRGGFPLLRPHVKILSDNFDYYDTLLGVHARQRAKDAIPGLARISEGLYYEDEWVMVFKMRR